MKKSNVYTRKGDGGETSLASGQRVPKTHLRLEAYGTADELSSHIGLLLGLLPDDSDRPQLLSIQHTLFIVGGILATEAPSSECPVPGDSFAGLQALESAIDTLDAPLGGWRGFILPGGTQAAAQAHVCRTVCRRLERRMFALGESGIVLPPSILQYVNRLSDYFFVLAKSLNARLGVEETFYAPSAPSC